MRPSQAASAPPGSELLAGLFEPDVLFAASAICAELDALPLDERACAEKAVAKRQREFAQGRVLARSLLSRLGADTGPLLRDADRVPLWPTGVVGSISHTHDLCAVAVAREGEGEGGVLGVGLDVEPAEPLEPELEVRICTPAERAWLRERPASERRHAVRIFFSVKECVYKACFPRSRERWGFQELEVELTPESEAFLAVPRTGVLAGRQLRGRVAQRGAWWLSAFTLRA